MLAERYDCILFDLDGVLYRGEEAVPAAPPTLAELRARSVRLVFLTNNSARTPGQVADTLRAMGIAADPNEVVTSALATAELLARRGGGRVFVIGEDGVREALAGAGLEILQGEPETADLVVVGFDGGATYAKLKTAGLLVQRGAKLVATNSDGSYPAADGLWPGAGALLSVITTTTGAEPRCSKAVRWAVRGRSAARRGGARSSWATGWRRTSRGPRGSAGTRCWCSRGSGRADVEATGVRSP
jgi:4-nitrophenyl phosphatase